MEGEGLASSGLCAGGTGGVRCRATEVLGAWRRGLALRLGRPVGDGCPRLIVASAAEGAGEGEAGAAPALHKEWLQVSCESRPAYGTDLILATGSSGECSGRRLWWWVCVWRGLVAGEGLQGWLL